MNVKDFLEQDEIKELIAQSDLETVYDKYYPQDDRGNISAYLLNLGVNPIDYFNDRIPSFAFSDCSTFTNVNIPDAVNAIGIYAFNNCSLKNVTFGENSQLTALGQGAFQGCKGLTTINIPESVVAIGSYAFQDCSELIEINIPSNITSINNSTFMYCEKLTSITIPDSVTEIDGFAFFDCKSLANVILGDNVAKIGSQAFDQCDSLTSIKLPESVVFIAAYAFCNCSNLTDIYYRGTKEQWKKIKKGLAWRLACPISKIHCIDGDIALKPQT